MRGMVINARTVLVAGLIAMAPAAAFTPARAQEGGVDPRPPNATTQIAYGIEYRGGPITGGITAHEGMEQPLYYWDPVIGPSGMAFYTADLFPAWKGSPTGRLLKLVPRK